MMLHYFEEAREGDALAVSCHLLEHDDKRMRVWLDMTDASGERLAASEQLLMSVALTEGAPARRALGLRDAGGARRARQGPGALPRPPQEGGGVTMKRKG